MLKGFPLELDTGAWSQKTRMTGLRPEEEVWRYMFSRLDTIHQRDRRTDGQSDTGRQQRPRLRLASRGKTDYAVWVRRYYYDHVIYCSNRFKLEFHFHSCFVLAVYAGFKVTAYLKSNISETARLRDKVTSISSWLGFEGRNIFRHWISQN